MGRFKKVRNKQNAILQEIVQKIILDEELLKYITYPLSNNPLKEDEIENPIELLNKLIFTIPKSSETIPNESVTLTIRTLMKPCLGNSNFRNILIIFEIISNINCINNIKNGDNRLLAIADIIDDIIYDSRGESWIGKVEYKGDYDGAVDKNYTKLELIYEVTDFV